MAEHTYIGTLDPWFETGLEGVVWSVYEDGLEGPQGLHPLEDGDRLEILDKGDGHLIWEGTIALDWEIGWIAFSPSDPDLGQQAALGWWVHGIQRGFLPDDWAALFFDRHVGVLTRKEQEEEAPEEGTEDGQVPAL